MRSPAVRSTFVAAAWIALGAAGYFLFTSQKTMSASASAVRATDLHAREADDAIADLRVGQQAYVASGQGVSFWMPKVAATVDTVNSALNALRQSAVSPDARTAAEQALAAIAEFVDVDKRARDYVRSGQTLMASDVIFTEGGQLTAVAARQVETARLAEHQAFDSTEGAVRRQQASAIGASAGLAAMVALLLGLTGARSNDEHAGQESQNSQELSSTPAPKPATIGLGLEEGVVSHARPAPSVGTPVAPVAAPPRAPAQARG